MDTSFGPWAKTPEEWADEMRRSAAAIREAIDDGTAGPDLEQAYAGNLEIAETIDALVADLRAERILTERNREEIAALREEREGIAALHARVAEIEGVARDLYSCTKVVDGWAEARDIAKDHPWLERRP